MKKQSERHEEASRILQEKTTGRKRSEQLCLTQSRCLLWGKEKVISNHDEKRFRSVEWEGEKVEK